MKLCQIAKKVVGIPTSDGAGVKLTRVIGQPGLPRLDPFLMLDEFGSENSNDYIAGFPEHPHRGFQTVTYMLDGKTEHKDSVGNQGIVESGGIQWMNAGKGIIHSEMPKQTEGLMRGFQLWVNLPATEKMSAPSYQDIQPSAVPAVAIGTRSSAKILAGELNGVQGPVATLVAGETLDVASSTGAKFILVSGKPINEPVVQYGPFVMNTQEEINQALMDFQQGRLA